MQNNARKMKNKYFFVKYKPKENEINGNSYIIINNIFCFLHYNWTIIIFYYN